MLRSGPSPVPWQQIVDPAHWMIVRQAGKDICEPGLWLDIIEFGGGDQRGNGGPSFGAALGPGEEMVLPTERDGPDGALNRVRVEVDPPVTEEATERSPTGERIADRLREATALRQKRQLPLEPGPQTFDDRAGPRGPCDLPDCSGAAPDLRLDLIEGRDTAQDFLCDRRPRRLMHIVVLPPGVRPACGQVDVAARGQRLEARIAIDLQDTPEPVEMRRRPFGPAIRTVVIENGRRIRPAPWPVIPGIDPEPAGARAPAAGIQDRQHRVIGKDPPRRHYVVCDPVPDRRKPPRRAGHPVRESGVARPFAIGRSGAGAWWILPQDRQPYFGRRIRMTLSRAGT